jgi:hypothetical protein
MTRLSAAPEFHWTPQPRAQSLVLALLGRVLDGQAFARQLNERLADEAGVRLADNLDYLQCPPDALGPELEADLRDAGFEGPADGLRHPGGVFPVIRLIEGPLALGVKCDCVNHFAATHGWDAEPEGAAGSRYRRVGLAEGTAEVWAVERHGWAGFEEPDDSAQDIADAAACLDAFRRRPRDGQADPTLFLDLLTQIAELAEATPIDWVSDLFFRAEREYWMSRNRAARVQYDRQQAVGIGWANHDHHTYRSSRVNIDRLIAVFEALGLRCRESFTPGPEAGWGAQVLEQPVTGVVVFADVDMSPEELSGDFSHLGLPERDHLHTVGLWCGLHGDSIFAAGMHHLECMFDFAGLADQLRADAGIGMMAPFSDFDHLKQQFTEGEWWEVSQPRLDRLREAGLITPPQAAEFAERGALGSHLENLERNDGFKGFNQQGITHIIDQTDPRIAKVGS